MASESLVIFFCVDETPFLNQADGHLEKIQDDFGVKVLSTLYLAIQSFVNALGLSGYSLDMNDVFNSQRVESKADDFRMKNSSCSRFLGMSHDYHSSDSGLHGAQSHQLSH